MTILGLGNDIIEVARIEAILARHGQHFLDKLFTLDEQTYCLKHQDAARHLAGRFAAKEAVVKAIGTGFREGTGWLDIEILNNDEGKPVVHLSKALKELLGNLEVLISISHCKEYASAVALLQKSR